VALVGLRGQSAQDFVQRLLSEQGVLLLPSSGLGFGDGHVRFGFGRLSFPQALEQLELYLARKVPSRR
jgi:aspartate/methionine/tyrosine aminotransferase